MAEGKALPVVVLVLGIVVVAILAMGLHLVPYGSNTMPTPASTVVTTTQSNGQTSTTTIPASSWTTSALQVNVVDRDVLASTGLTEGTNVQSDYWYSTTGQIPFSFIQAASTTSPYSATFTMQPTWDGIFYIRTQPVSGQTYYISPIATMQTNPCITGYDFLDVQNTGTQQWVFQCNMAQSGVQPSSGPAGGSGGTAPLMVYTAQAMSYTAPTMANNNGGSIKSIGTGSNALSTILYVEKTTTAKSFAIEEIDVAVNNTSATTYINSGLSNIQLPVETPNGAISYTTLYFSSANINGISDGTNVWWKWYFNAPVDTAYKQSSNQQGESLKGAYFYFALNNGSPQQIQFNTNIYTTLVANKNLSVTEYHTLVAPSQGTSQNSNAITLCAGTNCT